MQPNGRKRRLQGEINVVPYIDVMLVLLIIFMVTAPMLTQGVKVDLPKADAKPIDDQTREPLVVSLDRAGLLYVNVGGSPRMPPITGPRMKPMPNIAPSRPKRLARPSGGVMSAT